MPLSGQAYIRHSHPSPCNVGLKSIQFHLHMMCVNVRDITAPNFH